MWHSSEQFAKSVVVGAICCMVVALLAPAGVRGDSTLISVVFTSVNDYGSGGPGNISGPENTATAENPLFGAANVWNNLSSTFGDLTTNPTWSDLVDSNGNSTGVNLSITGTVQAVNVYPYNPSFYAGNPLRSYYLAWNSNGPGGESDSISWVLSGLAPNATYDLCAYGPVTGQNVSFTMAIGSNSQAVHTYADFSSLGCTYFQNLKTNASGQLSGTGTGMGSDTGYANEADWTGFQLVEVTTPVAEPPTVVLLLMCGLVAMALLTRKVCG